MFKMSKSDCFMATPLQNDNGLLSTSQASVAPGQVMTRHSPVHINTDELRQAWRRAGLWRIGMSFEQAQSAPLVRWALRRSALAHRHTHHHPAQPRLI
jgi:hypothetical protein